MIRGAASIRFMLAVTFAMEGTKLNLFVIFKGEPGGSVEKQIPEIYPERIIGCVQEKSWMDNMTMQIWYNEVYKSYIADADRKSCLLLGDFICRKSQELTKKLAYDDTLLYMIPTHYTGLLQLCDVSINKSLKVRLKNKVAQCRGSKHANLNPGQKLFAPKYADKLNWLKKMWQEFTMQIVKNSFKGCGYVLEGGIDDTVDTQSESDLELDTDV